MALDLTTDSIVQIFSGIVIAIVSIAAAFIAARYTEKYRDQNENSAEHFRQIKSKVLIPMLKLTDQYYLPILQYKKANLVWERRDNKRFAAGLSEEPYDYEVIAAISPPTIAPITIVPPYGTQEDQGDKIEKSIFDDCSQNHFDTLFNLWTNSTSKVDEYNKECLKLADSITDSIAKRLELPIIRSWDGKEEHVSPYCGVAIFNRMATTGMDQLHIGVDGQPGGFLRASFGNYIIQVKPSGDPQKLREVIEKEIVERREQFLEVKGKADSLGKTFGTLRTQLLITSEKQRLPGKCKYV
jgi:type II secretory pathway pseudopilin PulG